MSHIHDRRHQPSTFLVENIDLLPKGRALDLAMGGGRNAVYLSKIGYEAEGIDISREAVDAALELAAKERPAKRELIEPLFHPGGKAARMTDDEQQ